MLVLNIKWLILRAASNFPTAYVMSSFADLCFTTYLYIVYLLNKWQIDRNFELRLTWSPLVVAGHHDAHGQAHPLVVVRDVGEQLAGRRHADPLPVAELVQPTLLRQHAE